MNSNKYDTVYIYQTHFRNKADTILPQGVLYLPLPSAVQLV